MKINYNLQTNQNIKWQLYSFTTENIAGYIKDFNFENKSILTVAGSGDHILNAILLGSNNITAFDINPVSLFFTELKLIMAKHLTYNEFLDFFMINSKNALNFDVFSKFSNNLSNFSKKYFNNLYKHFNFNGYILRHSEIFNNKYDKQELKLKYNLYLTEQNFNNLKKVLDNVNLTLIESDIKDLQLSQKYDIVLLSNISDYLDDFKGNKLESYFKKVLEFKTNNNTVIFGYVYDIYSETKRSEIDHEILRHKTFNTTKYRYIEKEIESAIKNKKDCILILKGEK